MKKILHGVIYFTGCITLIIGTYVAAFFLIREKIILPYEQIKFENVHALRPLYNKAFYPLRMFSANGYSLKRDFPEQYVGYVKKRPGGFDEDKRHRSLQIDTMEDGVVLIGFVSSEKVLKQYDALQDKQYVRFWFGRALKIDRDRFTNRLIRFDVIDLMPDPRIETREYSDIDERNIEREYSSLEGQTKTCTRDYVDDYKNQVLEHCLQAGYADNIGGGCFHMIPYSVHTAVLEDAMKACVPDK